MGTPFLSVRLITRERSPPNIRFHCPHKYLPVSLLSGAASLALHFFPDTMVPFSHRRRNPTVSRLGCCILFLCPKAIPLPGKQRFDLCRRRGFCRGGPRYSCPCPHRSLAKT